MWRTRAAARAVGSLVLLAVATCGATTHPLPVAAGRLTPASRLALLRDRPLSDLAALAALSDGDTADRPTLTRTYLGPAHARAAAALAGWMGEAGLDRVWVDAVGNVRGRAEGKGGGDGRPTTTRTLLLGSHYDTVPDAGRFDGALGLVTALAAVRASKAAADAVAAPWPPAGVAVEVVAFADEEGVRFGSTYLGSAALAGTLVGSGVLEAATDGDGVSLAGAIAAAAVARAAGGNHPLAGVAAPGWDAIAASPPGPDRDAAVRNAVASAALDPAAPLAYVEAHMEQGPVLERAGARVGVVSAIAAQARYAVTLTGVAGHAGTVPMGSGRSDAGAAASEAVVAIERLCGGRGRGGGWLGRAATARLPPALLTSRPGVALAARLAARRLPAGASPSLVCTVGVMAFSPGAPNVIPGQAAFTLDVRDGSEGGVEAAATAARSAVEAAAARRGVAVSYTRTHAAPAAVADEGLTRLVEGAAAATDGLMVDLEDDEKGGGGGGDRTTAALLPRRLVSGAGHDAAALASRHIPWSMVFVRDRGGVSHTPAEDVRDGDVAAGAAVLWGIVEAWVEEEGRK